LLLEPYGVDGVAQKVVRCSALLRYLMVAFELLLLRQTLLRIQLFKFHLEMLGNFLMNLSDWCLYDSEMHTG